MIEKTCFSINKKEMWIGGTKNKMPLRSHLIFVCSVSSSNQFGWIPPYKNKMVLSDHLIFCCGRRGIRTPGTLTRTAV